MDEDELDAGRLEFKASLQISVQCVMSKCLVSLSREGGLKVELEHSITLLSNTDLG